VLGGRRHRLLADRGGAGEGDLADQRVGDQSGAGNRAGAGHDVEHPGRDAALVQ
jgi:hypothetical protein